jgi:hypothetical protein
MKKMDKKFIAKTRNINNTTVITIPKKLGVSPQKKIIVTVEEVNDDEKNTHEFHD